MRRVSSVKIELYAGRYQVVVWYDDGRSALYGKSYKTKPPARKSYVEACRIYLPSAMTESSNEQD